MKTIHQIPFAALGMGAAFTVLWGVADPVAAFAEVRTYTGVGKCAMGDLVSPEQAKNYAREMALQNAREQAGVYLTSYTRTTNTKLSAKEITAISNNITEVVGDVKYTQTPTEADGVPVVVYTATLSANVDTDGIKTYLERGEEERITIVSQSEQAQKDIAGSLEKIERLNEAYNKAQSEEEKAPGQTQTDSTPAEAALSAGGQGGKKSRRPGKKRKKPVYEAFGELLFTHFGLSGPIILTASCYCDFVQNTQGFRLLLDLKPAMTQEEVEERLRREFAAAPNRHLPGAVRPLFPARLAEAVSDLSGLGTDRRSGIRPPWNPGGYQGCMPPGRSWMSTRRPVASTCRSPGPPDIWQGPVYDRKRIPEQALRVSLKRQMPFTQ